jgi:hypothetical protein
MATTITSDGTFKIIGETLNRPSRFSVLAETSFKSPLDNSYSRMSRSSNEDGNSRNRRRMTRSPVSVNTKYELSEKNT